MSWEARNKEHTGEELIFQTLDWYCDDFENDKGYPVYKIFVFGMGDEYIFSLSKLFFFRNHLNFPFSIYRFHWNCIYLHNR